MSETCTGVISRVVDRETAVVLLDEDGEAIDQLHVPVPESLGTAGEGRLACSTGRYRGQTDIIDHEMNERGAHP